LDFNGNYNWVRTFGSFQKDEGHNVRVDNLGDVYITGMCRDSINFNPAGTPKMFYSLEQSVFTVRFDSNGMYEWAQVIEEAPNSYSFITGLEIDNARNIIVSGLFSYQADFDPASSSFYLYSFNNEVFVQKLSQESNPDGINENYNTDGVIVYPNPSNGNLFINSKDEIIDEIYITNVLGQILYSEKPQTSTIQIDLSDKASGIYFVNVRNATSVKSIKILKQ